MIITGNLLDDDDVLSGELVEGQQLSDCAPQREGEKKEGGKEKRKKEKRRKEKKREKKRRKKTR